jgi:hypothetical protein
MEQCGSVAAATACLWHVLMSHRQVGTGLVVLEYQRQVVKDAKKRELERRERMQLQLNAERERQVRCVGVRVGWGQD